MTITVIKTAINMGPAIKKKKKTRPKKSYIVSGIGYSQHFDEIVSMFQTKQSASMTLLWSDNHTESFH